MTEFSDDDILGIVNCENNVIPLCPNCHWEFDNLPRDNFFADVDNNNTDVLEIESEDDVVVEVSEEGA